MNDQLISPRDIVPANFLLGFFTRFPGGALSGAALTTSGLMFARGVVAALGGHLTTSGATDGFLSDPAMYANLVGASGIWAFNAWSATGISTMFSRLFADGVVGRPLGDSARSSSIAEEHQHWVTGLISALSSRTRSYVSLLIAVSAACGLALPGYLQRMRVADAWSMADGPSVALSTLWSVFTLFGVMYFIATCIQTAYWSRNLFASFEIRVRPMHPDGVGGLDPLVRFSMGITRAIVLVGALIVATLVTRQYLAQGNFGFDLTGDMVIGLLAYVVLAPFTFFSFTAIPHRAMLRSKLQVLERISAMFGTAQADLFRTIDEGSPVDDAKMVTLRNVHELYVKVRTFPVWPLNTANITRFVTTFLTPLVLGVLLQVLDGFFFKGP